MLVLTDLGGQKVLEFILVTPSECSAITVMYFKALDTSPLRTNIWGLSHWLFFWTVAGDETRQRVKFTDERVCKSHLLNCCPHDILSGTVSSLQFRSDQQYLFHRRVSLSHFCLCFGDSEWTWGSARRSMTWHFGQIMKLPPRREICSLSLT